MMRARRSPTGLGSSGWRPSRAATLATCGARRSSIPGCRIARMAAAGLPPLRDVIAKYDLAARRALGQNFLLDLNLTGKIARAAGDLTAGTTIEVGPGPGGLT